MRQRQRDAQRDREKECVRETDIYQERKEIEESKRETERD